MTITREQAQSAKDLVNTAESYGPLLALIPAFPRELLEKLKTAHDAADMSCNAAAEGQWCCVELLLENPVDYAPDKVAAAKELLDRYWSQPKAER
jgi:hypothetical protein